MKANKPTKVLSVTMALCLVVPSALPLFPSKSHAESLVVNNPAGSTVPLEGTTDPSNPQTADAPNTEVESGSASTANPASGTTSGSTNSDTHSSEETTPAGNTETTPSANEGKSSAGAQNQDPNHAAVNQVPVIEHTPVTTASALQDLKISAAITDDNELFEAKLFYQTGSNAEFKSLSMIKGNGSSYEAVIPKEELVSPALTYYIEVKDSANTTVYPTDQSKQAVSITDLATENFNHYPKLLITEISPDSMASGTDQFEYFEVYNNTDKPMDLSKYSFIYHYTTGTTDIPLTLPKATLEPKETKVFWFNTGNKTLSDFNAEFHVNLTGNQVVPFTSAGFSGFANGGNRAVVVKDPLQNEEVVSASYVQADEGPGLTAVYKYPASGTAMSIFKQKANPTPGTLEDGQVPAQPVSVSDQEKDTAPPVIEHTPIAAAEGFAAVKVQAKVTDDKAAAPAVKLYYKKKSEAAFHSEDMFLSEQTPSLFESEIPAVSVTEDLVYYIEAADGTNTVKTDEAEITVQNTELNYDKLPSLLITEIVPDSTNVGTADGYEFIEVYNNTDKDLNFKDYKLQYRYSKDPNTDVIWASIPDDAIIKSKGTLVFWIINSQNRNSTVADFNQNYGTNLVENQDIVRIYSDGMANSSLRTLVVATNSDEEISEASYMDEPEIDDTAADKGIMYQYPVDGSKNMVKISYGKDMATPGSVTAKQVPAKTVTVPDDNEKPVIENLTTQTTVKQSENIKITADAQDNIQVKTVVLYYKLDGQQDFTKVLLQEDYNNLLFNHVIYSPDLIGKKNVEYYFTASDGSNEVTSDHYKIDVTSDKSDAPLRLNVKDGQILSGEQIIKGTSSSAASDTIQLYIDGKEQSQGTYHAVEDEAYLAFDVSGVNTFFQNGVTMGDEVLHIFDDFIADWQTITVPIDPNKLQLGNNVFTIRSGDKVSPFITEKTENRDDYKVKNVRLVLSDGTTIKDAAYSNPATAIAMNDAHAAQDFTFALSDSEVPSKAFKWNTEDAGDGTHTVKITDGVNEDITAEVKVDNTAPAIVPTIEKDKDYKGEFTIDAAVTDEIAGVENQEVKLDDKVIAVPLKTASSQLAPGSHSLEITASDKAGNTSKMAVPFSVANENPAKPELISPADGAGSIVGSPQLKVKVVDPTNDDMNVSFYRGYTYNAANKASVKAFKNTAEVEPPQTMAPEGETAMTDDELEKVSSVDGQYLKTESSTKFPYHRFDVTLDSSVDNTDIVELNWAGKSLNGRKVTMYAWSYDQNRWMPLVFKIAGDEDFTLKANVKVDEFSKDHRVHVMIQDEIPSSPDDYDYTFVWMSDTQYYSESYPWIYDKETSWIAKNQDALKIKYVIHTGDLVDEADKPYQWENADKYMRVLDDANVPYGVLAGNHDVGHKSEDYTEYYKYFGDQRFKDKSYVGESYKNNKGHYDLISAGGNDYIIVYMGWGITDEDIAWMNKVLAEHPDRKAILNFHEYLLASGSRSPIGDKIYNEVILPNKNVFAALCGHYHESKELVDEVDDNGDGTPDRKVYQILADYQGGPEGGQGYMRLLHFDTDHNRVIVNTYSPYMNDYNFYDEDKYPGKDEFILDLNLEPENKVVETDSFSVNVYTDTKIGSVDQVKSGNTAEVSWNGLAGANTYSWYAVAEDHYTGKSTSDVWSFAKGTDVVTNPGGGTTQPGDGSGNPDGGTTQPGDGSGNPGNNDKPEVKPVQGQPTALELKPEINKAPVARMEIKKEVPLYKKKADGTYTKSGLTADPGNVYVYGKTDGAYNVGGDYYILDKDSRTPRIGRILIKDTMKMYTPDGKLFRTLEAGEAVRVYGYDGESFDVGGGYYVEKEKDTLFYTGLIDVLNDLKLYDENGKAAKTLKKGSQYRAYDIIGDKIYMGGGYYVMADKSKLYYNSN
ncbi:lamin tail domain-containing protein [Metabacillus sp. GX 13764]|uniref:lamin tail domain-containing protein n=1 Tax=Metabacillus kandeliae TaxID=2900151 RepID=UPI001E50BD87|nr:lamin tail domain-containing protein [Metabacillus kandeliae]MCD7034293.1 lamin tail domain-containing protein [Metabacillus kandeliae]